MVSPPKAVPAATFAVTDESELTVTLVAAVEPKVTAEVPVRPLPVIVTVVPTGPLPGEKDVTTGTGGTTVNWVPLGVLPPGVVTVMVSKPKAVPAATIAVTDVSEITVTLVAAVEPKPTAEAPVSPLPVIVTVVPTGPLPGEKDVTTGTGGTTVNWVPLGVLPPGVVTVMVSPPKAVPAATIAVTDVSEITVTLMAAVEPKVMAEVPVRPLPVIVTVVPTGPLPGEKDVTTGIGGTTVN
jgi:hypothetical protein